MAEGEREIPEATFESDVAPAGVVGFLRQVANPQTTSKKNPA
jgi:hypothetical protein